MSYASLLAWLLTLGPKIKLALPLLLQLADLFAPAADPGNVATTFATDSECEIIEGQVMALYSQHSGPSALAFDGSRLRGLFKFLESSGLLPILIGLI